MTTIGRVDFFANVDGPWVSRSREDFAGELDALAGRLLLVRAAGGDRAAEDFSEAEQFVIGVKDAAAWTLGVTTKAPFQPGVTVVSDAELSRRVADAQLLISLGTVARFYSQGVKAWLFWLIGRGEHVEYPA